MSGIVLDNDSGAPISGATIQLISENAIVAETESAEGGRFVLDDVGKGFYKLVASRNGYVSLFPQQSVLVATVADGQPSPVALKLTRTSFISGQVSKEDGQPARGVQVVAMQRRMQGNAMQLVKAAGNAFTDDQGSYRLYGLAPGIYTVGIFPNGKETDEPAFSPIYFPGTTEQSRAVFFHLAAGEGRPHADFNLEHRPGAKIIGVVGGIPSSWAKSKVAVCLFSYNGDAIQTVETDAEGRFVFTGAPRGSYQVVAWGPIFAWGNNGPVATPHGKTASLRIDAEDSEVSVGSLELHDLATVQGTVSPKQVGGCSDGAQVALEPLDPMPGTQVFAGGLKEGAFRIADVPAGRFRVELRGLRGSCYLTRVAQEEGGAEGMNITVSSETKVRLVLADDGAEVVGKVMVPSGALAPDVLLFPADRYGQENSLRISSANEEGMFRFEGIPPGLYQLLALPKMTTLDYMDPVFAAEHGAVRILLKPGSSAKIEVTLSK